MSADSQDFSALLARVAAGSPEAAQEFIERYGKLLLHAVRQQLPRRLRPGFDSLDFVQDVWVSFFAELPAKTPVASPDVVPYLARMARNKVLTALRRRRALKGDVGREMPLVVTNDDGEELELALPAPGPTASQLVFAEEVWERLLRGKTPVQQRILILLRQGFTHAEIAQELGISTKTAQRLARKALDRIAP